MKNLKKRKEKGITLIALVVTIVVLIILATVSINAVFGQNGLISKAEQAKEASENAVIEEQEKSSDLLDEIDETLGIVRIPEGLEVGSEVTYSASGTYTWQAKYYSSSSSAKDKKLNSAIRRWKVLSLDEVTGTVELIAATTGSSVELWRSAGV